MELTSRGAAAIDVLRRRKAWEVVTPIAFVVAGIAGLLTASAGLWVMFSVMATALVITAALGRIACST